MMPRSVCNILALQVGDIYSQYMTIYHAKASRCCRFWYIIEKMVAYRRQEQWSIAAETMPAKRDFPKVQNFREVQQRARCRRKHHSPPTGIDTFIRSTKFLIHENTPTYNLHLRHILAPNHRPNPPQHRLHRNLLPQYQRLHHHHRRPNRP